VQSVSLHEQRLEGYCLHGHFQFLTWIVCVLFVIRSMMVTFGQNSGSSIMIYLSGMLSVITEMSSGKSVTIELLVKY